jgi:uroporphyrinogen decarboxylase
MPIELENDRAARLAGPIWTQAIVHHTPDRIYTRTHARIDGKEVWSDRLTAYYIDNPPTAGIPPEKVGLSSEPPTDWEDVLPSTQYEGLEAYRAATEMMGEDGVIGLSVGLPGLGLNPESVYEYYDDEATVVQRCEQQGEWIAGRTRDLVELRPDFILIGISGFMLSNPEPIFRRLALPTLQAVTRICKEADVPSQIHCCGPEYALVRISAKESDLSSINPLEIPPMGDCDLARLKREFGGDISLMGNLHTTEIMLRGTPEDVRRESRRCIDVAGEGGGFVLSTGDQCGRDTPDENIFAMIEVAREHGVY